MNASLLNDAILDAKAVRATALANARQALEEAFAPKFSKLAGITNPCGEVFLKPNPRPPADRNVYIHILKD